MEINPRYWSFVRGIHRTPVNSPHKGQWRGALMFSFICAWINDWINNREAGDLRRHRAHYDVILMPWWIAITHCRRYEFSRCMCCVWSYPCISSGFIWRNYCYIAVCNNELSKGTASDTTAFCPVACKKIKKSIYHHTVYGTLEAFTKKKKKNRIQILAHHPWYHDHSSYGVYFLKYLFSYKA